MSQPSSRLFSHPDRPEWGRGLLVAERDKLLVIHWEDGKEHLVAATHRHRLNPIAIGTPEEGAVVDRIKGMQARSTAPAARAKKSASRAARPAAPTMSFDSQVGVFELSYPGGFAGEKFTQGERGAKDEAGKKEWAIGRAQELFAEASFADGPALYNALIAFLRPPLNLVHPMEGAIPLKSMKDEAARAGFIESLRELLHGSGDYNARFDRFVAAIQLPSKDGKSRRPGWPLVTLPSGLYRPGEHLFIKPQLLQKQAAILGMRLNYQSAPTAAIYNEFAAVGRALEGKLREKGHAPRDLLDVASFVSVTLSPNTIEPPAAA